MSALVELDREYGDRIRHIKYIDSVDFDALCGGIEKGFPGAKDGRPMALADTGEVYVTFHESAYCRQADVGFIKQVVLEKMAAKLTEYFMDRPGILWWRTRPEEDLEECPYAWRRYGIYMRLLVSDKPALSET